VTDPVGTWLAGLDHVQVAAPPGCEEAAREFYGGLFGLPEVGKPPALARRGGCWFKVGLHELHVGVADPFTPATKAHPGLRVTSSAALRELARRLAEAGVELEWAHDSEMTGRVRLHLHDPFGNRLELLADDHTARS